MLCKLLHHGVLRKLRHHLQHLRIVHHTHHLLHRLYHLILINRGHLRLRRLTTRSSMPTRRVFALQRLCVCAPLIGSFGGTVLLHIIQIVFINPHIMQTNRWGNPAWTFLGATAYEYPTENVTKERQEHTAQFYRALPHTLPCVHCRRSLAEFYTHIPPADTVFASRETLTRWWYSIHNRVNKKLRDQYFSFYDNPQHGPCDVVGTCTAVMDSQESETCLDIYPHIPWACTHADPSYEQVTKYYDSIRAGCS